jgi:hypothetical protein
MESNSITTRKDIPLPFTSQLPGQAHAFSPAHLAASEPGQHADIST